MGDFILLVRIVIEISSLCLFPRESANRRGKCWSRQNEQARLELSITRSNAQNNAVTAGSGKPQALHRFRYSDFGRQTYSGFAVARSQQINSTSALSAMVVQPAEGRAGPRRM